VELQSLESEVVRDLPLAQGAPYDAYAVAERTIAAREYAIRTKG
jgi:hypothetical protein